MTREARVRVSSVRRLALLVTGLLAAEHAGLAPLAAALDGLGLTAAADPEHIERRLRRALNDPRLTPQACYEPMAAQVLAEVAAARPAGEALILAIDESSKADELHLFRVSLAYRGGALPLVWALWEQNVPLPDGQYWREVDQVLTRLAALLPPEVPVVVTADRAFDIPPFIDRLAARGWSWVIRAKAGSDLRFTDPRGREQALREVVHTRLPGPGTRWKTCGQLFKRAGGREVSVIGCWAPGAEEPLVILSDLPPRWALLATYGRRFWIEPSFRSDKTHGWQWEASRIQGPGHHQRLLVAMAWASLLTLSLGAQVAAERLTRLAHRQVPCSGMGRPRPTRESLFTQGLRRARRFWDRTQPVPPLWGLPDPLAPSWFSQWYQAQSTRFIFQSVRL
jgi:hypothetical protein